MRNAPMRLACPACLGVALEGVSLPKSGVELDHCPRCGGTWILRAHAARLRAHPADAVRATITRNREASFLCHGCHAPMERDLSHCPGCGAANTLECPGCGKPLRREARPNVTLDVCRRCEGVWLDHHELSTLWAVAAAGAMVHASGGTSLVNAGVDAGSFLLDALWYAPDLTMASVRGAAYVAGEGLELAANVASNAPGLLSSAPEAASGFFEVAGDVAGAVFDVILSIIGGIFEGFSL